MGKWDTEKNFCIFKMNEIIFQNYDLASWFMAYNTNDNTYIVENTIKARSSNINKDKIQKNI